MPPYFVKTQVLKQLCYYTHACYVCQEKRLHFSRKFWESCLWRDENETIQGTSFLLLWGSRLCGAGAFVAGAQSQKYVFSRRHLLFAAGQPVPAEESCGPGAGQHRDHHICGIVDWAACQPGSQSVGLPEYALEFPWADMPCLFSFVDPAGAVGNGALPPAGKALPAG